MVVQPEPDERPAWERLPGEPAKAHAGFRTYRDLPALDRRLEECAEQLGVTSRACRKWAARWDWRERAQAWDDECARIEDRQRLEDLRTMHENHRRAGRTAMMKGVQALANLDAADIPAAAAVRLLELGTKLERSTLTTSVAELQGVDIDGAPPADPWERIAAALEPT